MILHNGGIIAYPTESCYGLGCDPHNNVAIRSLLKVKHRHWQKGLILVAGSVEQLYPYIDRKKFDIEQAESSWPGPTTWVVPAMENVSHYLRGKHSSIAVRVSDHPLTSLLCRTFRGPIVSTSANPEGHPPALSGNGVRRYFGNEVIFTVEGPLGELEKPTPIYDVMTGNQLRA
ncbi:MAG: Sua5/YciO/YrdC/YwlC family protein [Arenicellales bacterium]